MASSVFHRSVLKQYPIATQGSGIYIQTSDGKKILDGCSGAAVSNLGHNNPEVISAIITQAQSLSFAHTSNFTSQPAEDLAELIIQESGDAFEKAYFLCSGSEAMEAALKMARQYHLMNDQPERVHFIGREFSYHGNTLGALAAGHNPARRDPFAPILSPNFHHVSRCFYDLDGNGMTEREYEDKLIREFEAKFQELGPHTIAAVIVEPVVGATLGTAPATSTYLPRLKQLCEKHGALLIFDEVMCGMGRVGTYHAWQSQSLGGVPPHLQTIGKGLAAGYQPVSAVLVGKMVYDVFAKKDGQTGETKPFISAHTYQGHSIGCAAALAVQTIMKREKLVDNVVAMGEVLKSALDNSPSSVSVKTSTRGLGLFRTVDFGKSGDEYGGRLAKDVKEECFKLGAAVYLCSEGVDGILFAPPLIISEEEVKELVTVFWSAVTKVVQQRIDARRGEICI